MRDYQTYSTGRATAKAPELVGMVVELRLRARRLRRSAKWFLGAIVAAIVAGGLTYVWLPRWVAAESVVIDRIVDKSVELGGLLGTRDRLEENLKRDKEVVVQNIVVHGHSLVLLHGGAESLTGREISTDLDAGFFSPNGLKAWVVGESGVIVSTMDGGERWTFQKGEISEDFHEIHFAQDLNRGWIVGEDGVLLTTEDGGSTWSSIESGVSGKLWDIYFTDDSGMGWIVGENGLVLRTIDMGISWRKMYSGSSSTLFDVHFLADGLNGWTVGSEGEILKSIDGGKTWTSQQSGVEQTLIDVYFDATGMSGWAVGRDGVIVHTRNGGESWTEQDSGTEVDLMDVEFWSDLMNGVIVGSDGIILSTEDGGRNWMDENGGHDQSMIDVDFVVGDGRESMIIWVVGTNGRIFRTTDDERNWEDGVWEQPRDLNAVEISPDGNSVWLVGQDDLILYTEDSGNTWVSRKSESELNIRWHDVDFLFDSEAAARKGWVVGSNGVIFHSVDGGESWEYQNSTVGDDLFDAVFFESSRNDSVGGWIVGEKGLILKTVNGGESWSEHRTEREVDLYGIDFSPNMKLGWAAGKDGEIFVTSDGGETWSRQESGLSEDFYDVEVVTAPSGDETVVWIAGRSGTVISTRNGGESWVQQRSGTSSRISDVHFDKNINYGWAVGHNGTVLVTPDGGNRWHPIEKASNSNLLSIRMPEDGTNGWAVGVDGTIVRVEGVDVALLHEVTDGDFLSAASEIINTSDLVGNSFVEQSMRQVRETREKLENILRRMKDTESTIGNMQTNLFLSKSRMLETDVEMEERFNMLKFLEKAEPDVAMKILDSRNASEDRTIWTTNLTRLGVVGFFVYMIALLVSVYRYNMRLAAFYDGRADALSLVDPRGTKLVELVEKLAPDDIQYGKSTKVSMDEGVGWIERMLRITRRQ